MSDYLTDEEQLARLKTWWDENGTATIVSLVLVIVGAVGWRWYDSSREATIVQASDLYQEFLDSGDAERGTIVEKLAREAPNSAYPTLALMRLAHDAVASGAYDVAEQRLEEAVTAAAEPELADVARLRLARVQQQGDRSDAALQTLGAIRGEGFRSHVAELKGDIHLARGERLLAHEAYVAALADSADETRRPILEIKIADTANAEGEPAAQARSPAADEGSAVDVEPDDPVDSNGAANADDSAATSTVPDSAQPAQAPDA